MQLYFFRHGVAEKRSEWKTDDDLRPLTDDGRTAIVRSSVMLTRLGVAPEVIVTSPLVRARQTAEIVGEALGVDDKPLDSQEWLLARRKKAKKRKKPRMGTLVPGTTKKKSGKRN